MTDSEKTEKMAKWLDNKVVQLVEKIADDKSLSGYIYSHTDQEVADAILEAILETIAQDREKP